MDFLEKIKKHGKDLGLGAFLAAYAALSSGQSINAEETKPKSEEENNLTLTLDDFFRKKLIPRSYLEANPRLWAGQNPILTYEKNGKTYLYIPNKLMDGKHSEESPELRGIGIVQKGSNLYLRRYYLIEEGGRLHFDDLPLSKKTIDNISEYFRRRNQEAERWYKNELYPAVGSNIEGKPYGRIGFRHRTDKDTAFTLSVKVADLDDYEIGIGAEKKGRSIFISRFQEDLDGFDKYPNIERTGLSIEKSDRKENEINLAGIDLVRERTEDRSLKDMKFGEWKENDSVRVKYGEGHVLDNCIGLMYVFEHDGKEPGMICAITQRGNDTDHSKKGNLEVLATKLLSRNYDATLLGKHNTKRMVEFGYRNGSPVASYTEWLFGGNLAVTPIGYGRSTERHPRKRFGKPGHTYSAVVVGMDLFFDAAEKIFKPKKDEYDNELYKLEKGSSLFLETMRGISFEFTIPHDGSNKLHWAPRINFTDLKMRAYNTDGRY